MVDALGWRRVLAGESNQPPGAPLSRGLEVHPDGGGRDLDVWIERSLVRYGYGWSVPAGGEQRVGVGSYEPRDHVRRPRSPSRSGWRGSRCATRATGSPSAPARRPGRRVLRGDSAGHCFPLSGEGIRTAFYFGIACGRELRSVLSGERGRDEALRRYASFSASHSRTLGWRCGCSGSCRACRLARSRSLYARSPVRRWSTAPSAGTTGTPAFDGTPGSRVDPIITILEGRRTPSCSCSSSRPCRVLWR